MAMSENRATLYAQMLKEAQESLEYWTEAAILDFTEDLTRLMKEKGMTRSQLAKKIGSSQAYVTKVLGGNVNFTLASMTKLARALDCVVRVHIATKHAKVHWLDEPGNQQVLIDDPNVRGEKVKFVMTSRDSLQEEKMVAIQ
jgi:transcriptional regulator with XRE-family HTH domain